MFDKKNGYKYIVKESEKPQKNTWDKVLAITMLVLAIAYLIMPIDYDRGVIGRLDDFFIFMTAFCYLYASFFSGSNLRVAMLLKVISCVFAMLGAFTLLALSLFM